MPNMGTLYSVYLLQQPPFGKYDSLSTCGAFCLQLKTLQLFLQRFLAKTSAKRLRILSDCNAALHGLHIHRI